LFTRATGFVIVPLWLAAMGWLIAHDIMPAWTALEVPPFKMTESMKLGGGSSQHVLLDDAGEMGRLWTTYLIDENSIRRDDLIWIDRVPADIAPLRVLATSTFTGDGVLDELTVIIENEEHTFRLHGERFATDFSFTLDTGDPHVKAFKVPIADGSMVTAAFNPFGSLGELEVGQRWRIQVFNPAATLMPLGDRFFRMVVEVTGEERIKTPFGERNCLVVESPNARAWVDATGAVIKQELALPLIGKFTVLREPEFDQDKYVSAKRTPLGGSRRRPPPR
jgi:hypothetical protein